MIVQAPRWIQEALIWQLPSSDSAASGARRCYLALSSTTPLHEVRIARGCCCKSRVLFGGALKMR